MVGWGITLVGSFRCCDGFPVVPAFSVLLCNLLIFFLWFPLIWWTLLCPSPCFFFSYFVLRFFLVVLFSSLLWGRTLHAVYWYSSTYVVQYIPVVLIVFSKYFQKLILFSHFFINFLFVMHSQKKGSRIKIIKIKNAVYFTNMDILYTSIVLIYSIFINYLCLN